MSWLELGGSLAAVLAIAVVARWLKLGESRLTDPERAREIAQQQLAGFVAGRVLVSEDGSAALVAGNNGTVAVLRRRGSKVTVRRLIAPIRVREAIEGITIDSGDRSFGAVTLTGVIASDVYALQAPGPTLH